MEYLKKKNSFLWKMESAQVREFMEPFRLKCLNDPIMQALYRDEIRWSDVPDDDPPLELDHWREENAKKVAGRLQYELHQLPPVLHLGPHPASVPSSPSSRSVGESWRKHSAPTTPQMKPTELRLEEEGVLPPPCTPIHRPVPVLFTDAPPLRLKSMPRKILDAIREVDSAPATPPSGRRSPVPSLLRTRLVLAPSPVVLPQKRTVFVRALDGVLFPNEASFQGAASCQYGRVDRIQFSRNRRTAFLRFVSPSHAAEAVEHGIRLHKQTYAVEYAHVETA